MENESTTDACYRLGTIRLGLLDWKMKYGASRLLWNNNIVARFFLFFVWHLHLL